MHVARMWEKRNTYKVFVGKPEGKNLRTHNGTIKLKMILKE